MLNLCTNKFFKRVQVFESVLKGLLLSYFEIRFSIVIHLHINRRVKICCYTQYICVDTSNCYHIVLRVPLGLHEVMVGKKHFLEVTLVWGGVRARVNLVCIRQVRLKL